MTQATAGSTGSRDPAVSHPLTGWSTPSMARLTRLVMPSFAPITWSPPVR